MGRRNPDARKALLESTLKELMKTHSFDKITIKMITEKADIVRPVFYNYFHDKYDLLESVFQSDILDKMEGLVEDDMVEEAVKVLFVRMEKDKEFYSKAFEITGQNSFTEIMETRLAHMFKDYLDKNELIEQPGMDFWTEDFVSKYYAVYVTSSIRNWIMYDNDSSAYDMIRAHNLLATNNIWDLMKKNTQ